MRTQAGLAPLIIIQEIGYRYLLYRVFTHDVTAALLVSQINETNNEHFSHANAFLLFKK